MARRSRVMVVVTLVVLVIILGASLALVRSPKERREALAAPPAPLVTGEVSMRLLRDVVTVSGSVQPGAKTSVKATVPAGTARPVVTQPGPAAGVVVSSGDLLTVISGQPIFLLTGDVPLYRDITPGATGADVASMQSGLAEAGYYHGGVDGDYGPGTQAAVGQLWDDHGFEPIVDPAAATAVTEAAAALAALPSDVPPEVREAAHATLAEARGRAGPVVPMASVVTVAATPVTVVANHATLGKEVAPDAAVLELSGADPVVVVNLSGAQAALVRRDLAASITVGAGAPVAARVASVGTQDPNSGQVPVTLAPDAALPAETLASAATAEIELQTSGAEVLAVPSTAVRSDATGADYVEVPGDGDDRVRVTVEAGPTIAGYVQVMSSDPQLVPGDEVVVSG